MQHRIIYLAIATLIAVIINPLINQIVDFNSLPKVISLFIVVPQILEAQFLSWISNGLIHDYSSLLIILVVNATFFYLLFSTIQKAHD